MLIRCLAGSLCYLLLLPGQARLTLSVDTIMRGPGLYGYAPQAVRWSGDSQRVYFRWKRHDEPVLAEYSTYVVNRDGSGLRKLTDEDAKEAPPVASDDTLDWKLSVYASDGDIFLYDQMAGRRHRLTHTTDTESSPRFTQDEKRVTFVRGNNLYVLSPRDGAIEQLTDIRSGGGQNDDEDKKGTDSQEFLKKEERDLLETVRERAKKREEDRDRRKKENPRKPFRLAARQSVRAMQLSPDESFVTAIVVDRPEKSKQTSVPNYVTESAYTAELSARTKVGDTQSRNRVLFLDVKTGESKWLDAGIQEDGKDGKKRDRALRYLQLSWSHDGSKLAVAARAADNKDLWLLAVDPKTAKARTIVTMHDDAWVGGPVEFTYGWLPDNERLWFPWERDGWSHLYTVPFAGGEPKQLTSGKWEVREVALSTDRRQFLLTTSEVDAGEEHLYRMSIEGGTRTKLTAMPGAHDAKVSPDGTAIATFYSYVNKPPELYVQDLGKAAAKKVTDSPARDFQTYPWLDVPIVRIPARDGVAVPARLYKGPAYRRGGPLVVFVHGAGYLQNVHRKWSSYAREYMFHHLLMERGYLVLDVDYRGSAGYGRDWRTAIYRHMGGKDLDDQVDAVRWAVKEHGVDAKRVGIYGGSYGGFITLMALFTQPDVFAAGASLRPVTDWAHYNHDYTSNILNVPQTDAEAYRRSSPIYHAQGLKGALLIAHGMVDVNVHFQDTVRLVQRLIELRKENWELAAYPVEDHAFVQPTSWADEYKRILKLFEQNLRP
ncbi:MAG: prolyl oligopeptidase family serine peptidase [Bryobacteraceae bacterium]